jgi:hypothetical protein
LTETENIQIYNQKRIFVGGPVLCLHDDYLAYFGDHEDFKIRYEDLPPVTAYRLSRQEPLWVKILPLYCMLVGLVLLYHDQNPHLGVEGARWFVRSLAVFLPVMVVVSGIPYLLTKREFTILPSAKGEIKIARGGDHDVIIETLRSRRLTALRRFAVLNPLNPREEENVRFQWLRDEGVITEEEFFAFKQMILEKVHN